MIQRIDVAIQDLDELIRQINKRLDQIDREFQPLGDRIVLREGKSLSGRPERDMEIRELRVRDNAGTLQLILRYNGDLYSGDLTKESV